MANTNDRAVLDQLALGLVAIVDGGIETETKIASETGVDQPTISNAKHGKLKRVTRRIWPLISYVNIRVSTRVADSKASELTRRFFEVGGTDAEFAASIEHAIALLTRKHRPQQD